jgi:Ser-tRNA(Ala) deacylase AlaX
VTEVRKQGDAVWHTLQGDGLPDIGAEVRGTVDWERRHKQSS